MDGQRDGERFRRTDSWTNGEKDGQKDRQRTNR